MENNNAIQGTKDLVKFIKKVKKVLTILNINLFIVGLIFIIGIMIVGMLAGSSTTSNTSPVGNLNLSTSTLQWQDAVTKEAEKQEVPELVPYIMAIIEVESKGVGKDIMQSSESAGLAPNSFSSQQQSIEQGIKYLKSAVLIGENLGFNDFWAVVQSYNFGTGYVSYLATQYKNHSVEVAEEYSRNKVAPSLGNSSGNKYSYVNAVSQANGKTYLYTNGGNFHYADLVRQYVGAGSGEIPVGSKLFETIMAEAIKYQGNPYVWGGSTPMVGFDCSGLVQWVYSLAGINIPRVTHDQFNATEKVSIEDAEPGDLIFFKGTYGAPDYISHVGIYIDETRMYDANGSGVGYHYWSEGYWGSHFAEIHRVVK